MSPMIADDTSRAREGSTTSAAGAMRAVRPVKYIIALCCPFDPGTASYVLSVEEWDEFELESQHTNSGYATSVPEDEGRHDSGAAILELRRLTGLTWDQLARLFQVARRSLHFWASGKPLNAANEEQLYRTLATVRAIDRGNADENRTLLLREHKGRIPLDLLAAGRYAEVIELVGAGPGRAQRRLAPLSPEAHAARVPLPPEVLANALQDRVHDERGQARSASSNRSKRDR